MPSSKSHAARLSWPNAQTSALLLVGISVWSLVMLVGMGFQPGWANGWPLGISKHVVFASFVTTIFAVASLCGAASRLIAFGCLAVRILKKSYTGWIFFVVAMTLLFVTVSATCPYFYATVYADILREWP